MQKSSLCCDVCDKQRSRGGVERGDLRECIGDLLNDGFGIHFIGGKE